MLVPRTRLILWSAGILLPFATIGALAPASMPVALLCIGAFILAAVADASLAPATHHGVRAELPGVVRLQNGRGGTVSVHLYNNSAQPRLVRVGVAFPPDFEAADSDRFVQLPGGSVESKFDWSCKPRKRGLFLLDRIYLETTSRMGFWAVRGSRPIHSELRVYPDLISERERAPALFLRRADFGQHAQRAAGQGREFEKLREFVAGDSLSEIHWKATAKRGRPVTKVHQIERSHQVYLVIDASRLSARKVNLAGPGGSGGMNAETTSLERYVTAALMVALAAERQGDQFGLITFSDKVLGFVRARSGQSHFDTCREALYTLQPQDASPDFEEVATFIRLQLRKRALLIFLTALDDPVLAKAFVSASEMICREQLILANMLLPEGSAQLFSSEGSPETDDDVYRRLGGHLRWNGLRELQKVLQRRGVRLSFLDPAKLSAELIAQHSEVRARQLL